MKNKKILVAFGTRPEAIKMAPVIHALKKQPHIEIRVLVSGQHREMLDQVLELFEIKPDYDLQVMQPKQSLADLTSRVMLGADHLFRAEFFDRVLVHGDTTTTLSVALAAFYHQIKVGHVEAGLRTGDLSWPWPEEMNRKLTTGIADLHFAPTKQSRLNLLQEGVRANQVFETGNTVIDALLWVKQKIIGDSQLNSQLQQRWSFLDTRKKLVLVTVHRRENWGAPLESICRALQDLSHEFSSECQFVLPVHLNPAVRSVVERELSGRPDFYLLEPLNYLDFVFMMMNSHLILTDSGGVQEEAPSLGVPVLCLRETTERPEAVEAGTVLLVGHQRENILAQARALLRDGDLYAKMAEAHNPYGDGRSAQRIVEICCSS